MTTQAVNILALFVVIITSTYALVIQPTKSPCSMGDACNQAFSRSFVNNQVFCCPNGDGMNVNSVNNIVKCTCNNGYENGAIVNGRYMNATEAQPFLDYMREEHNRNMQTMQRNLQNRMARLNQNLAAMRQRIQNNVQNQMLQLNENLRGMGQRLSNMFRGRFWG